jgi:hypothetical protein
MKVNDCENCPFFWIEQGLEDCDCGCELSLDYGKHRFLYFICYMPTWSLGIIYKIAYIVNDIRWRILTKGKEE